MLLTIIKELQVFRVGQVHGSRSVRDMLMSSSSGCRSLHDPQPTFDVLSVFARPNCSCASFHFKN